MKISVTIITLNEERNIRRCIHSVLPVADEIIVLDSFSIDDTVKVAKSLGAKVFQQKFDNYIQQKNDAVALCTHDVILSLDADECLNAELTESILTLKQKELNVAASMNRCTFFCGKFIRHGSWYPDRKIRLFNRKYSKWAGEDVHETVKIFDPSIKVVRLKGEILHYSFYSVKDQINKMNRYTELAAKSMYKHGKRAHMVHLMLNPSWAFLKSYFFKLGFLDGLEGFSIAIGLAHATFLKYFKLRLLQLEENGNRKKYSLVYYMHHRNSTKDNKVSKPSHQN